MAGHLPGTQPGGPATGTTALSRPVHADALIVGAGSAGSMLAAQLTSDPSFRVVLLERGPQPAGVTAGHVADGFRLPLNPADGVAAYYWANLTSVGDQAELVRGAVVGGSGAVNGGYFVRGRPADFDGWDLPGWSWSDVRVHFSALETDADFPDADGHGSDGPVPVCRASELSSAGRQLIELATERGVPLVEDLNGAASAGVGRVPLNIEAGVRMGPARAVLDPVAWRPNLMVYPQKLVLRVVLNRGRAVGVELVVGNTVQTLTADRIVLCAGAIESARLLMLSGIGPADELRMADVPVAVDLPGVGSRLMDHPEWLLNAGVPGEPGFAVLDAVLHTDLGTGIEIRPYSRGFVAMTGAGADGPDDRHIGIALMTPVCRGRMELRSADPLVAPYIDMRYDSESSDMDRLREGVGLATELYGPLSAPTWSTSQHLCSTAPMGTGEDPFAVVDERCRVRGVESLFVVDGSILPTIPSRGPAATIAMVGRRAAPFVAGS